MENEYIRRGEIIVILAILGILTFLTLKPILISIIVGIILAIVLAPIYDYIVRKIHLKNISALLICILFILFLLIPIWFLLPIFIKQSLQVYSASSQYDFSTPLKTFFPSLFSSDQFTVGVSTIVHSFVTNVTNSLVNSLSGALLNFPELFLQFIIIIATLFFVLRDKAGIISYIRSMIPFPKDVEERLFRSSKDITFSVVFGQVLTGIIQGLIVGVAFFIFSVPNFILLTFLAIIAGIFPIVGTGFVWVPVMIYLFIAGSNNAAIGVLTFGLIAFILDHIIRPAFVSRRTKIHPLIILIGMIGGLFYFGILGFIIGPLILAYILIIFEVYRGKEVKGVIITHQ